MTKKEEATVQNAPPRDETEVGSYFIANYPPFSFWRPDQVTAAEKVLSEPAPSDVPLGLYLHIPFCRKRCKFCYFRVYTDKNASEIQEYTEALAGEMRLLAERPALSRRPTFVYFGGGTPSFLSVAQLESLIGSLSEYVAWDDAEEVTFECEPGTLSESKVEALKSLGVTRLSLGVENFDDAILEQNGRAHLSAEIERAWGWIAKAGFEAVNIDLIAGMVGETDENWERCIGETIALAPESVTIYQMELPYNTVYSREILTDGAPSAVATWSKKREWVELAFRRFREAGYHVSSGYTLVRDPKTCRFVYRDALWHGADMIGLGVASFSYFRGVHYQNLDKFDDYVAAIQAGRLPLARALPIDDRERLIRELILQMKLGRLSADYFQDKFGVDILESFEGPFRSIENDGYLRYVDRGIELTSDGLARVDSLLPSFFLQEHRDARYT